MTNGIYSGTFDGVSRVFLSTSLTLYKSTFQTTYIPRAITNAYFYKDTGSDNTYVYKGSIIYYHVYFYPITSTPDNGFIRLTFGNGVKLSP